MTFFETSFESSNQRYNMEIIFLSNNKYCLMSAENMLPHRHQRETDWELECKVENIYFVFRSSKYESRALNIKQYYGLYHSWL